MTISIHKPKFNFYLQHVIIKTMRTYKAVKSVQVFCQSIMSQSKL